MANTKSAAKSARQDARRRERNASTITGIKTRTKKLRTAIEGKDATAAKAEFSTFSSSLDKAVKSGTIHRNAANRRKSRLNKALVKASAAK
jgi:small subunit ribosomal protein S20